MVVLPLTQNGHLMLPNESQSGHGQYPSRVGA